MKIVTLSELFQDAPYFRAFEGIVGAKYHIKNPYDHNAPGLWFVKVPERLEIAHQVNSRYDGTSRETARRDYEFSIIDVQPGDAVYDYNISFRGSRDGYDSNDERLERFSLQYKAERDNGAFVHFHIPKKVFHQKYQLDEEGQCYREKPYRKKFMEFNSIVKLPDGSAEQVSENCEAVLKNGQFSFQAVSANSAFEERVICGQPLRFYTREFLSFRGPQKESDNPLEDLINEMPFLNGDSGLGFMGIKSGNPGEKLRNPYRAQLGAYMTAKREFNRAGMVLSPEQQGELHWHLQDIVKRYAYFERNPVVM